MRPPPALPLHHSARPMCSRIIAHFAPSQAPWTGLQRFRTVFCYRLLLSVDDVEHDLRAGNVRRCRV